MSEWHHFRVQLEGLGVDPYAPDEVPADHPHFAEVQRIVAEYRGIPLPLLPQPKDWEGSPPLFTITSLDDVARWLCDEWSIVVAIKMGSDDGILKAKKRAMQAIRNAHRILDVLKIEDQPLRQPPAENLEGCKKQIQQLKQWFREKHASGWTAKVNGVADTSSAHGKRREFVCDEVANAMIEQILKEKSDATSREIAEIVGIAHGRVSQMPAWRARMAEKKASRLPRKMNPRQLTEKMLKAIPSGKDPAEMVEARENVLHEMLRQSEPAERERILAMSNEEQDQLIQSYAEQLLDEREKNN